MNSKLSVPTSVPARSEPKSPPIANSPLARPPATFVVTCPSPRPGIVRVAVGNLAADSAGPVPSVSSTLSASEPEVGWLVPSTVSVGPSSSNVKNERAGRDQVDLVGHNRVAVAVRRASPSAEAGSAKDRPPPDCSRSGSSIERVAVRAVVDRLKLRQLKLLRTGSAHDRDREHHVAGRRVAALDQPRPPPATARSRRRSSPTDWWPHPDRQASDPQSSATDVSVPGPSDPKSPPIVNRPARPGRPQRSSSPAQDPAPALRPGSRRRPPPVRRVVAVGPGPSSVSSTFSARPEPRLAFRRRNRQRRAVVVEAEERAFRRDQVDLVGRHNRVAVAVLARHRQLKLDAGRPPDCSRSGSSVSNALPSAPWSIASNCVS